MDDGGVGDGRAAVPDVRHADIGSLPHELDTPVLELPARRQAFHDLTCPCLDLASVHHDDDKGRFVTVHDGLDASSLQCLPRLFASSVTHGIRRNQILHSGS